jgi:hypothetical protein
MLTSMIDFVTDKVIEERKNTYLYETIMEMKSKNGRPHPRILLHLG